MLDRPLSLWYGSYMPKYIASNYSMGRAMQTIQFEAAHNTDAQRIAEHRMPSPNALPGTHPRAAAKARVIGIRYA